MMLYQYLHLEPPIKKSQCTYKIMFRDRALCGWFHQTMSWFYAWNSESIAIATLKNVGRWITWYQPERCNNNIKTNTPNCYGTYSIYGFLDLDIFVEK